jgi:F-type H+-transporting ATPase subunit delta
MSVETVARRYATALADVVMKTGEAENVRAELKSWEQMIAGNAELEAAFGNPAIAAVKKEAILEHLIGRSNPSKTTANFLRILLRNGRLTDLALINERLDAVMEERSGVVSGEVISAHELDEPVRTELKTNLEKLTGKTVNLNYQIDRDIIGGVITRVGSTVYDSSVRTKLKNLKEQLVGA